MPVVLAWFDLYTVSDDISGHELGNVRPEDWQCAELPPILPLLQLADSGDRRNRLRRNYVLRGRRVCVGMRCSVDSHLLTHPLHYTAETLGRCLTISDLPPGAEVPTPTTAGAREVLETPNPAACQRPKTTVQAHPILQFVKERRSLCARSRHYLRRLWCSCT